MIGEPDTGEPGGFMDRSIHAASAQQGSVRRVDNSVHGPFGDISLDNADYGFRHAL
jgi:hypothetical protein